MPQGMLFSKCLHALSRATTAATLILKRRRPANAHSPRRTSVFALPFTNHQPPTTNDQPHIIRSCLCRPFLPQPAVAHGSERQCPSRCFRLADAPSFSAALTSSITTLRSTKSSLPCRQIWRGRPLHI